MDEPPRDEKTFATEAPVVARDLAATTYPVRDTKEQGQATNHGPDIASAARLLSGNSQRTFHAPRSQLHPNRSKVQKKPRSALHRSATMKKPVSKLAAGKQKRKAASVETTAEQRLRSHHQRGCGQKHICKSIWVSEHFLKFRCHAAVARSTFASQNVKIMKVSDVSWHAVVARSTFASQNAKIMRTF